MNLSNDIANLDIGTSSGRDEVYDTLASQTWRYLAYKQGRHTCQVTIICKEVQNLKREAFDKAVNTLISRHESLRTLFFDDGGNRVYQKVYSPEALNVISDVDISREEKKEELLKSVIAGMSQHLFDFQKEPSIKFKLVKVDETKLAVIIAIDHMIYDAHSIKIIEGEISILYNAYLNGCPNPLLPLKAQFRDYVAHHNANYHGQKLEFHQSYYKNLFKNPPSKPKILTDNNSNAAEDWNNRSDNRQATPLRSGHGNGYRFVVPGEVFLEIKLLTSRSKTTFFNFMLSAYCVFLSKITDQNDFLIDSPMSTRNSEDFSKIVGWLTGALITRVKVANELSFKDLLVTCRDNISEGLDHIHYQMLAGHLGMQWNEAATQLNVINDFNEGELPLQDSEPYRYGVDEIYFDFSISVQAFRNGIVIDCQYKNNFMPDHFVSKLPKKFINTLRTATISPNLKIKYWSV